MATGYTRQSVFVDGDVILAEHGNLEFNQLVGAFSETTGHSHDGTVSGGDYVPLLKDPTGVQDLILGPTGVTGTVVLDETDLISNSPLHLATQQSIKVYVDTADLILQTQIDGFANSNHGHPNLPQLDSLEDIEDQLDQYGRLVEISTDTTLEYGIGYTVNTQNAYDIPNTITTDEIFYVVNTSLSLDITISNQYKTINGNGVTLNPGDNIILEPGNIMLLRATDANTLEVI